MTQYIDPRDQEEVRQSPEEGEVTLKGTHQKGFFIVS